MEEETEKSVFSKPSEFVGDSEETFQNEDLSDSTSKSRRPPNAYILYCLEKRTELRNIHPELPNIEISRMLGQNWKSLEEVARRPYKEKAKILQAEFKKEHPDYKYEKARKKRITQEILMTNNKSSSNSTHIGTYNINLNALTQILNASSGIADGNSNTFDLAQILSNENFMKCILELKQKQQAQQQQKNNLQNQQQQTQQQPPPVFHNTFQQDFQQNDQNDLNELITPNPQGDTIINDSSNLSLLFNLNHNPASPSPSLGLSLNAADGPSFASDFSYMSTDFQTHFD